MSLLMIGLSLVCYESFRLPKLSCCRAINLMKPSMITIRLYSEILQIHGPTTGRNDVEWQKRGRLWCGGARSSSTRSSKLIVVAPQQ